MPRLLPLVAAAAGVGFALVLLVPSLTFAEGSGVWVKLLFTPQAGVNSACLSCGWHDVCTENWNPGPALDFPASCSDSSRDVYFRTFALLPPGSAPRYVGTAAYYMPDPWQCKEVQANIWDTEGNLLGRIRYVHAEPLYLSTILLLASADGLKNELAFANMANPDNQACIDRGWWTPGGVHVHESHVDDTSTFFLRDDGDCSLPNPKYPCGPQPLPYPTYDPQDWWNDWARGFCIDDKDCDGWTDDEESYIGTDPEDDCPDGSSDDAWPPDFNNSSAVTSADLVLFSQHYNDPSTYDPRYDLNASGPPKITDGDLVIFSKYYLTSCTNP